MLQNEGAASGERLPLQGWHSQAGGRFCTSARGDTRREATLVHVVAVAMLWMCVPRGGAGLWRTLSFQALGLDQDNEKGLYRRGEARLLMNEFELAKCDFQKVLEVNPQNKAARSQISVCQKKTKEHNERDRRIYANMFTKFAERDAKVGAARAAGRPDLATLRDAQQARGD